MVLLEVIVQSVADAVAAGAAMEPDSRGGADRLELVRALEEQGLTPTFDCVRAVCEAARIPVYVMIRPRNGFVLASGEREILADEARMAVAAGALGLVTGYLTPDGRPDLVALEAVREAAGPGIGITFHRAFDRLADPLAALPLLAAHGVGRVLTSGGARTAAEGRARLREWSAAAVACGVRLMAGGGLTPENVAWIVRETGVAEVHFGTGVRVPPSPEAPVSKERVAAARQALMATVSGPQPR